MILSEIEKLYKNDPVAFTLWLNEAKNMASKEGDIARALIENNNTARKSLEKSTNKSRGSSTISSSFSSSSLRTNDRICICSPTTHVGSFKCKYHRNRSMATSVNRSSSKSNQVSDNIIVNAKPQPKQATQDRRESESFNGLESVRTVSASGQPRLSRFGRAACEDVALKVKVK